MILKYIYSTLNLYVKKALLLAFMSLFLSFQNFANNSSNQLNTNLEQVVLDWSLKSPKLSEIFKVIENNSIFYVNYDSKTIDVNKKLNLNIIGKYSIKAVLSKVKAIANINFEQVLDNINVTANKKNAALQNQVKGTVTDSNGIPLLGVTVLVLNGENGESKRGSTTDFDGNYTIVASDTEKLQFSYIGF